MRKITEATLVPIGAAAGALGVVVGATFWLSTMASESTAHGAGISRLEQQLAVQESTIRTNNEICTQSVVNIEKAIIKMQADVDYLRRATRQGE